jgi:signal transduction histidine kinase
MSALGDSIVAQGGLRARAWGAGLLITVLALLSVGRALMEPSLGWRFHLAPQGQALAISTRADIEQVMVVSALSASGDTLELTPNLLIEASGLLHLYAEQDRFHSDHAVLWRMLQQPTVVLHTSDGPVTAVPQPKHLNELGLYFWLSWGLGLLSLSIGLAVWVYRPKDSAARWYAVASLAYTYFMLLTACTSSRLLTQPPLGWAATHQVAHATGFLMVGALCMLLLRHPTRLKLNWVPFAMLAWSSFWLTVDVMRLVPSIALGYRLPSVIMGLLLLVIFCLQWRACHDDPVRRAQIKWFGFLLFASFASISIGYFAGALGHNIQLPLVAGLGLQALLFVGLVPLVTRLGLFQLERWWAYAWLWFLGGLVVVLLDMLLLAWLPVSDSSALALALAVGGWVYFPLRQAVWNRLSRGALPDTQDVLPDILALVAGGPQDDFQLNARWRTLWDKACQPLRILPAPNNNSSLSIKEQFDSSQSVVVRNDGQELWIPAVQQMQALCLFLPERGQRLFRPRDTQRANEILRLVQSAMASHLAFESGARHERQNIAADLHDDLGATLLSIAQASAAGPVAGLARHAIEELRLSVRGLTVQTSPLQDVIADWRSETVSRLTSAGIQAHWPLREHPADLMLVALLRTQITRVLREAISNVIRHSAARNCQIDVRHEAGHLVMKVQDDGRGMPVEPEPKQQGMGLTNMARRIHKLGGELTVGVSPLGGVALVAHLPLAPISGQANPTAPNLSSVSATINPS